MLSGSLTQCEGCSSALASAVRIKVKAIGFNRAETMWRNDHSIERGAVAARPSDCQCGAVIDADRQPEIAEATNDVKVAQLPTL